MPILVRSLVQESCAYVLLEQYVLYVPLVFSLGATRFVSYAFLILANSGPGSQEGSQSARQHGQAATPIIHSLPQRLNRIHLRPHPVRSLSSTKDQVWQCR